MQRSDLDRYYADNVGLVHMAAKKGYARLLSIGASYSYDDMVQELSIVFIKAYDAYDANTGFKFSSYFMTSAYHQINKIMEPIIMERIENKTRSVEEMTSWTEDGLNEAELIPCDAMQPMQRVQLTQDFERMVTGLSPLAEHIVRIVIEPPEFVERELDASGAHASYAREKSNIVGKGKGKRGKNAMSMTFVCGLLEKLRVATALELRQARQEIRLAAERSFG